MSDKKSWDDAGANCRQLNSAAHLVVMDDEVEHAAVLKQMTDQNSLYQFSNVLCIMPRLAMTIS